MKLSLNWIHAFYYCVFCVAYVVAGRVGLDWIDGGIGGDWVMIDDVAEMNAFSRDVCLLLVDRLASAILYTRCLWFLVCSFWNRWILFRGAEDFLFPSVWDEDWITWVNSASSFWVEERDSVNPPLLRYIRRIVLQQVSRVVSRGSEL